MIADLAWAFLTGLAGSLHCLGMCGPIVILYSVHLQPEAPLSPGQIRKPWSKGLVHHAAFQSGRLTTYALLGALAAGVVHMAGFSRYLLGMRSLVALAGGAAMIGFGLILMKVIPLRITAAGPAGASTIFGRFMKPLFVKDGIGSKWFLGFCAGFLPCMLSWAMVIEAASTGHVLAGFSVMLLFGLGTVPVLFVTGLSASIFTLRARLAGERIAAVSVIVMGFILLMKGVMHLG